MVFPPKPQNTVSNKTQKQQHLIEKNSEFPQHFTSVRPSVQPPNTPAVHSPVHTLNARFQETGNVANFSQCAGQVRRRVTNFSNCLSCLRFKFIYFIVYLMD
jgi:hypothetical protein